MLAFLLLAALVAFVAGQSHTPSVQPSCISSCFGLPDGNYQSCSSCNVYASCVNQVLTDDRPCPPAQPSLQYDSHLNKCVVKSSTCPSPVPMRFVCYYDSSWASTNDKAPIPDIPVNNCTHMIYEYGVIKTTGDISLPPKKTPADLKKVFDMKKAYPNLKIILSLGSGQSDDPFATILSNAPLRYHFIYSVAAYMYKYGFDGLNLYRANPLSKDKFYFGILTQELNCYFFAHWIQNKYQDTYTLSMDIIARSTLMETAYDWLTLRQYVTFFNVLAFDFYRWHGTVMSTGLHSALKPSPTYPTSHLDVEWVMNYMVKHVNHNLLNLVISTIGTSFTLCTRSAGSNLMKPGAAKACGAGDKGPTTNQPGVLAYFEVCNLLKNNGWTTIFDTDYQTPYAYNSAVTIEWVGYESPDSAVYKVKFAKTLHLGGVGLWDAVLDDWSGVCQHGTFPIMSAIATEIAYY